MKRKILIILTILTLSYVSYDSFSDAKSLSVSAISKNEYVLGGDIVGIKLYSDGLMCLSAEKDSPGDKAGIKTGDIILTANGKKIQNTNDFIGIIRASDEIDLTFDRSGIIMESSIKPEKDEKGNKKAGLWVRDSIAGVGTVTFYDKQAGKMYSLGHSVSDADTKRSFNVRKGYITNCEILSVKKGEAGDPGEICGSFTEDEKILGYIEENKKEGLVSNMSGIYAGEEEFVTLGTKKDIKNGEALLYSAVIDGDVKPYLVEIKKVYGAGGDILVEIKDERLLEFTGGIVQGMSGSPVVQNGKLIGAVTHVFVNDPTRGYGIFIENMLAETEKIK